MRIDKDELERINDEMQGWTIDKVTSGSGENLFVFHLSKDGYPSWTDPKKRVILCGNDLGGWMKK